MKALRTLLSVAVLGIVIAFSGCGGGGGNTAPLSDRQFGLLKKKWKVDVNFAGGGVLYGAPGSSNTVDSTSHWTNFTIEVKGTTGQPPFSYECTGRHFPNVWKGTGTWTFGDDPATQIVRDDGAAITYSIDPASSKLQLAFSFTGGYTSRVSNVSGSYTFHLIPN